MLLKQKNSFVRSFSMKSLFTEEMEMFVDYLWLLKVVEGVFVVLISSHFLYVLMNHYLDLIDDEHCFYYLLMNDQKNMKTLFSIVEWTLLLLKKDDQIMSLYIRQIVSQKD